ncbi:MAG TPA: hypothetical protein VFA26_07525 [Gemmataceae bacterium]|nr:hypothetical protein [Gemmataceae bacterium]
MLATRCPHCGQPQDFRPQSFGTTVRCRACTRWFPLPETPPAPPPPRKRSAFWVVLAALAVPALTCGLCCGGVGAVIGIQKQQQARAIAEADQLYADGEREEAVARYKNLFATVPADGRAEVVRRIVEHELGKGDAEEAERWLQRGLDDGLKLTFDSPAAKELLARAQRQREERGEELPAQKQAKKKRGFRPGKGPVPRE